MNVQEMMNTEDFINSVSDMNELSKMWLIAKENEAAAMGDRRKIEDRIKKLAKIAEDLEGTETVTPDYFTIKIVGRIDRKVDSDKLQELAAEAGLTEHLSSLFRWTPEINMAIWKASDERITRPLVGAITAKPGRPSFKITIKE
jgi:hypothetical protein